MFNLKMWGGQSDTPPIDATAWSEYEILGLDYENKPRGEVAEAQLGGYISPKVSERIININFNRVPFTDWFGFIDNLTAILIQKYVYITSSDYPSLFVASPYVRIVPNTELTIEHQYEYGNKALSIGAWLYE